ncbi:ATP-binding cassette domain-containing protein, partial [Rhizobium ruizarguesonis]
MSEPQLKIEGLDKSYGGRKNRVHALSSIYLELADNEYVSLVGASGCGKSTLQSIVAGIQGFDNGVLRTDGAPIVGPG